ncbi:unnamed protein product [Calypogeia fissa]
MSSRSLPLHVVEYRFPSKHWKDSQTTQRLPYESSPFPSLALQAIEQQRRRTDGDVMADQSVTAEAGGMTAERRWSDGGFERKAGLSETTVGQPWTGDRKRTSRGRGRREGGSMEPKSTPSEAKC